MRGGHAGRTRRVDLLGVAYCAHVAERVPHNGDAVSRSAELTRAFREDDPVFLGVEVEGRVVAIAAHAKHDPDAGPSLRLGSAGFDRIVRSTRSNGHALRAHAYPIAPDIPIRGVDLRHYLTYGWGDEIENDWVWSIGELHSIRANLLTPDATGSYRLNLAVGVFLPSPDHEQIIKVYAAGQAVGTFAFSGRDYVLTDLPIPVRGPIIDLVFETPHAISPRAAGLSADARPLAFKVRYFYVDRQL